MSPSDSDSPEIAALRRALAAVPGDVELTRLLAERLLSADRPADAAAELSAALRNAPGRDDLTLLLARALEASGDGAAALTVLESHVRVGVPSPASRLALARRLLAADRPLPAAEQYRLAIGEAPELADDLLARRLRVDPEPPPRRLPAQGPDPREFGADDAASEEPGRATAPASPVVLERPRVTFRDVGGMEGVKESIRLKIIHPLNNPELYRAYGRPLGGGILLYGPPGCGKTHLARATAGEIRGTFQSVGIHDVLDMWMGESERKLHALFEEARAHRPAVLFFDEVDALGAARADLKASGMRHLVNQFLAELDGVEPGANDGVLVLAATNAPWHLDGAFLRAGRFDRVVFVPPPDLEARARIVELLCLGKPTDGVDPQAVAKKTDAFSGADLKSVVDRAIEAKLEEAVATGRPTPLRTADLLAAAKTVRPSTRDWFATARNYVLYSNQSGLYDEVRGYLKLG